MSAKRRVTGYSKSADYTGRRFFRSRLLVERKTPHTVYSNAVQPPHGFTLLELMIVLVILVLVMAVSWPRITGRMQLVSPREAALQLKADLAEAREQAVVGGEAWGLRIERGTGKYEIGPIAAFRAREESASPTIGSDPLASLLDSSPASTLNTGSVILTSAESKLQANQSSAQKISSVALPTLDRQISLIELSELPIGMIFDDGIAHSTQDANQIRIASPHQPNITAAPIGSVANPVANPLANPLAPSVLPVSAPANNWKYVVIFQPDGRATESEVRLKEQSSLVTIRLRIRGFTGGVTIDPVERRPRLPAATDPLQQNNAEQLADPLASPSNNPLSPNPNGGTTFSTPGSSLELQR